MIELLKKSSPSPAADVCTLSAFCSLNLLSRARLSPYAANLALNGNLEAVSCSSSCTISKISRWARWTSASACACEDMELRSISNGEQALRSRISRPGELSSPRGRSNSLVKSPLSGSSTKTFSSPSEPVSRYSKGGVAVALPPLPLVVPLALKLGLVLVLLTESPLSRPSSDERLATSSNGSGGGRLMLNGNSALDIEEPDAVEPSRGLVWISDFREGWSYVRP